MRVASVRKSAEGRPDSKLKLKVFQEHKKGSKSLKLDRRDGRRNRKSHQDCSGIQIRDPPFRSLKTPNRSSQNKAMTSSAEIESHMLLQLLRSLLIATTERPTDAGRVLLPKLAKGCDGGNCSSIWCAFSHQKVAEAGTEGKTQRSSANAASELEQPEPVALRLPTDAAKRNEEL